MTGFQLLGLMLVGVLVTLSIRAYLQHRATRRGTIAWSGVWLVAGVCIAEPEVTVWIARLLGIGRGTDLVLYFAVLAMGVGFFLVYARLRQIDANLTRLVRHEALRDALAAEPGALPSNLEQTDP